MKSEYRDIEIYLEEVKELIKSGKYRIDINANRQDNQQLFTDYVIDEALSKKILLALTANDFSEIVQNRKEGYEHEQLYIFGKTVNLLERFGNKDVQVDLYIKINRLERSFVVVISFHKCKHSLNFPFK